MRLRLAVLAGVAAAHAPALAESGPVTTSPLAPGEVLVEVNTIGSVRTPADMASITAIVIGRAPSEAAAEAARDALVHRVTAAARAAGVGAEDLRVTESPTYSDVSDPAMMQLIMEQPGRRERGGEGEQVATSAVEVRIRDVQRAGALRRIVEEAGAERAGSPSYSLLDDAPARRAARSQAIARARSDAEAYAAALGMRVARVVRVTERVGFDFFSLFAGDPGFARRLQARSRNADADVETQIIVGVDFALAPQ